VASCAKATAPPSSSGGGKSKEKEKDNKSMKRNLKEPNEWKDHAGKTHVKHLHAFTTCKSMSALLWNFLDEYKGEMKNIGDDAGTSKDVRLSELVTYTDLIGKIDNMQVRETLEYALITVHEQSVVIYLTHHYSYEVVSTFTGD
jgi:hypothetical protein